MSKRAIRPKSQSTAKRTWYFEIFVVSFAALLLEISYTRVISFKLYYYYTYLVIGLALLGIGSGGVFVAISGRIRNAATEKVMAWSALAAAASIGLGYAVIAYIRIDTRLIWEYGSRASFSSLARLFAICLALFFTFLAIGVMIATLFSRFPDRIGRLYFYDLLAAGLACGLAIFLHSTIGPPAAIFLSGLLMALVAVRLFAQASSTAPLGVAVAASVVLGALTFTTGSLPEIATEGSKHLTPGTVLETSSWGSVFRVDAVDIEPGVRLLHHDGLFGSAIYEFDGDFEAPNITDFDNDFRSYPFTVLGRPPERELIIGSAGGHEILASIYFDSKQIDAVELNPVTYDLVTNTMADWSGNLDDYPSVNLVNGDGRSFLARSDHAYDLIWFVAPDSYAANNAASSGAFVLSESYLYTQEMVEESLHHLSDDGIIVAQFGEFVYDEKPNRTTRYVATVRAALEALGVDDPSAHVVVATSPWDYVPLSTIMVKRTPFTPAEVERFATGIGVVADAVPRHLAGAPVADTGPPTQVLTLQGAELEAFYDNYGYDVRPITDNAPFFWHFTGFGDVIANIFDPIDIRDPEDAVGERVLLLLLGFSAVFAAVFLLLPFVAIREKWRALPSKRSSALYFAALGLGFMFFEITMIQKLTLFLGFPTYSLTVTLAAILIFTGVGALLSSRLTHRSDAVTPALWLALAGLTVFYQWGLTPMTEALLPQSLTVRVAVSFLVLAPLGLILGMFMPFGLHAVAGLSDRSDEYVAWAWAINGFFSVIGSVLTTILSMTFGFRTVLFAGLAMYAFAVVILRAFTGRGTADQPSPAAPLALDLADQEPAPTVGSPA